MDFDSSDEESPVDVEELRTTNLSLPEIFHLEYYHAEECAAAIRGEKVPYCLGHLVARLCVLRGIRYHAGFATEFRDLSDHPEFSRALNARSIMSNDIPNMTSPEEFPYCIWHPDVATEETYRELARGYPQMRYHVGRACAVAGYLDLYRELDLLPDVSIAEEARDNQKNGETIFNKIMSQPVKSVNPDQPRRVAGLNGDTAVRSLLDIKQRFTEPMKMLGQFWESTLDENHYFNITEDCAIDEYDSETPDESAVAPLLYSPLPTDLPPSNKDILILVAAYNGDIDIYARLRRPKMISSECECIIRGIYHSTMFAKWWSLQPGLSHQHREIRQAIHARFIMSNDLSRIKTTLTRKIYHI
ncbi:hypothetical protein AJ80_01429 [Polytolypa hystricis UAMH7299]|uniref:Uncharacterized protein n=1 Tax=Polytolypa hystricis (strain UAMH7299) TaxID=1447883 RepID=A0A2B7Z139_POLH7|nr:hypothetical protein AJ80_01429 [Polytolypa hystricis UAMH7299]